MIAALVAALVLLQPFVLYVPMDLGYDLDTEAFTAEVLAHLAEPVGDHPGCFCGVTP